MSMCQSPTCRAPLEALDDVLQISLLEHEKTRHLIKTSVFLVLLGNLSIRVTTLVTFPQDN